MESEHICMWCGKNTFDNKSKEHIFPECIGGNIKLIKECVCDECNNKFSRDVDEALKKEHPIMMDAYQDSCFIENKIIGKKGNKERKERKKKERYDIKGIGEAENVRVYRDDKGKDINFCGASFVVNSPKFVRSLHKCAANVLCSVYGPSYMRNNYKELLDFVKNGKNIESWSYAVSYRNYNDRFSMEPRVMFSNKKNKIVVDIEYGQYEIVCFIHTSGIWIIGSYPYLINKEIIEYVDREIFEELNKRNEFKGHNIKELFGGFGFMIDNREFIGKLRFLWCKKELEGKSRCKICGQKTPTGITISKDVLRNYKGGCFDMNMNSWNYTIRGIPLGLNQYVRNLKINNCICKCIGCGNLIKYNASNCFI